MKASDSANVLVTRSLAFFKGRSRRLRTRFAGGAWVMGRHFGAVFGSGLNLQETSGGGAAG